LDVNNKRITGHHKGREGLGLTRPVDTKLSWSHEGRKYLGNYPYPTILTVSERGGGEDEPHLSFSQNNGEYGCRWLDHRKTKDTPTFSIRKSSFRATSPNWGAVKTNPHHGKPEGVINTLGRKAARGLPCIFKSTQEEYKECPYGTTSSPKAGNLAPLAGSKGVVHKKE